MTTHILLIDDHPMFRSGLAAVLAVGIPCLKIFEVGSLHEAMSSITDDIEVALLDIKLKGSCGMEGIALLKRKWPQVHILMLSSLDEPETVREAMAHGAAAFVSKAEPVETIIEAIRMVLQGDISGQADQIACPEKHLTARQHEVLMLLYQGLSNRQIAQNIFVSDNTVRRHVQDILKYFKVASRAEAVCAARRKGLVG